MSYQCQKTDCQPCKVECGTETYPCTEAYSCQKTGTYTVYTPSVTSPSGGQKVYGDSLTIGKSADAEAVRWEWAIYNAYGQQVLGGSVEGTANLSAVASIAGLSEGWYSVRVRHQHWRGGWSYWSAPSAWYRRTNQKPYAPSVAAPPEGTYYDDVIAIRKSSFADPDQGDGDAPSSWRTPGSWQLAWRRSGGAWTYVTVPATSYTATVQFSGEGLYEVMVRQSDAAGLWSDWSGVYRYEYRVMDASISASPNPVRRYERLLIRVELRAGSGRRLDGASVSVTFNGKPVSVRLVFSTGGRAVWEGTYVPVEPDGTYVLQAAASWNGATRQASIGVTVGGEVKPYVIPSPRGGR